MTYPLAMVLYVSFVGNLGERVGMSCLRSGSLDLAAVAAWRCMWGAYFGATTAASGLLQLREKPSSARALAAKSAGSVAPMEGMTN